MVGLLWPLAVVSFWFVVFVSAILLASRFSRMPDAALEQTREDETPSETQGAEQRLAVEETGA